ncbi:hypothetical protein [Streptomyces griseomycini]|uniref:Uncharacterized protein n=1 Tax=Streptomyces griseomycini TaxID=66895 RepID=A0A7W7PUF4_9ACTN|nr:hypothetical protein [Streptomyces griseomycini]MBB4901503.1 hypothetical protein [Streptomyces griseomycini]GGQ15168.1 hypothetical protein GCM10010266_43170 [Streptomyces griseomycini]GGR25230.1 hypothetical protein GCM10015536_33810 [Streptomyces griseomycini]
MLMLTLLLVLATGAFAALAVLENFSGGPEYTVEMFGNQMATLSAPGLFLSGVALTLIFCLGLAALAAGLKRRHRMRATRASGPTASTAEGPMGSTAEGRKARRPQPAHRHRGLHLFGH